MNAAIDSIVFFLF